MTHMAQDSVLDGGLTAAQAAATAIYLCTQDPADRTGATSTYAGGNKTTAAGSICTGPAASTTPTGRKLTSINITDGDVTASVTVTDWALVSAAALLINGGLSGSQAVVSGNKFTLGPFDMKFANQ
jgi:hypothetical protein